MRPPNEKQLRVLFIHGLEGTPQGKKPMFLREHFDTIAPAMDTSDLPSAITTQAKALLEAKPDVVVGSSFGGAIAISLLEQGIWKGPTVLLAPAAEKLSIRNTLPKNIAVTIIHGTRDDIIPIEDSQALAKTGTPTLVKLIEVNDDHRLQSLLDTGSLADYVRNTHARQPR